MAKPFEDALFTMQAGEITGPVKTDFGWHVIQLREVKAGSRSVRGGARPAGPRTGRGRSRTGLHDLSGKLVDLVYKNPTTLAPAGTR